MMMDQQHIDGSSPMMMEPQPTTTTTTTTKAQEDEEEDRTIWMGDLQNWRNKVEGKEVRTLRIGDLRHWMDEDYINYCFDHTGEVFTSKVIRNKKTTGNSSEETCYGLILFKSHAIAERILNRFNGTPMPRVAVGTNFNLNWATAKEINVVTDGRTKITPRSDDEVLTTMRLYEILTTPRSYEIPTIPILPRKENTVGVDSHFARVEMGDYSSWEKMLKCWSLSQFEGTCTAHIVRATNRVYEIASFLKRPPIKLEDKCLTQTAFEIAEGYLDELQSHVESINVAKDLHSMGALEPLLCNMSCEHAGVGAKAAKLVSTMVQNNPRSQQLVMEAGGEEHLFYTFFCAVDATTVTNVISAISSLFRNDKRIAAFRQSNGYADLINGLDTVSVISQRKTLNLIRCLVQDHNLDCNIVTGLKGHHIMMDLVASSYCADVREASLSCLLLLTKVEGGGSNGQLVKNDDKLKRVLQERIERISAMAPEDLGAAREEIQLVDSLWNACYNKPSSLEEKGLLVTYEEAPALGPPSAATPTF